MAVTRRQLFTVSVVSQFSVTRLITSWLETFESTHRIVSVFADATSYVDFISRQVRNHSRVIVNRIVGNGEEIMQQWAL